MAKNNKLPPSIKIILKSRYPLPCAESESSGDGEVESNFLKALADGQEEERNLSLLPCAESGSSGADQIESDSLEALADGQDEERWDSPLVVPTDGKTEKYIGGEEKLRL